MNPPPETAASHSGKAGPDHTISGENERREAEPDRRERRPEPKSRERVTE